MERRRRKDEPFNPFAPNASAKARVRRQQAQHRDNVRQGKPEPEVKSNSQADLAAKQKAAIDALRLKNESVVEEKVTVTEKVEAEPIVVEIPEVKEVVKSEPKENAESVAKRQKAISIKPRSPPKSKPKKKTNREDRLATLRAKSAATAEFAKQAKQSQEVAPAESEIVVEEEEDEEIEELEPPVELLDIAISTNIFKTIKTEKKKVDRRPKRRRADKRGGGRQTQSRKLDRRKYLEYKYAARELLDNDAINEEHRSNVLGQIWAKGERIGVEEAIAFIDQKETELILPSEIANEFRKMVKKYTTKR